MAKKASANQDKKLLPAEQRGEQQTTPPAEENQGTAAYQELRAKCDAMVEARKRGEEDVESLTDEERRALIAFEEPNVQEHKRCPVCWEQSGGVGQSAGSTGNKRYVRCRKTVTDVEPCSHTWNYRITYSRQEIVVESGTPREPN